jgi:hypothetical protein
MTADQQIAGREAIEQMARDVAQLSIAHGAGQAADAIALCEHIGEQVNEVIALYTAEKN